MENVEIVSIDRLKVAHTDIVPDSPPLRHSRYGRPLKAPQRHISVLEGVM